ncbi:MAG TPA: L,D-transpeptidase [Solirubrobacteraceae bacterium]|nr:L,D-transpeptidase [Solirubrobacteraceae bacterium]
MSELHRKTAGPIAVVAAVAVLLAMACSAAAAAPVKTLPRTTMIARIVEPVAAYAKPGGKHVLRWLSVRASWAGGPVGLMVTNEAVDAKGRAWLRVQLPGRPNGHGAWVRRSKVFHYKTPWSIEVRLHTRMVILRKLGRPYRKWRAVIGAPPTPTPVGLFAVAERDRQPNPGGFYGPWILRLTARSEKLKQFDGGPGTVGLHGRGGASLLDPLGSARSHGCVRLSNDAIARITAVAREGTPVLIKR